MMVRTMDNTCIICGNIIPEGRQVCPTCGTTESDIFGKLMGRKIVKSRPEEDFKVSDEVEQAYRQGINAGFKQACEIKQENARLKREIAMLRSALESRNDLFDSDGEYE